MRPGAKSRVWPAALGVLLAGVGRSTPASGQRNETPLAQVESRARADSNDPVLLLELAQAYLRERRSDEARRALETAIQIDRQFAPAYALLGRLLAAQGGPPVAVVVRPDGGRLRIVVLRADSTMDSTTRLFRRAFLLNPMQELYPIHANAFPVVWRGTLSHALSLYRRDQFDRAAAAFDSVIVQSDRRGHDPPPVALWYHALSVMQLQRVDLAIHDLERLLDRALRDSSFAADVQSRSARYILAHLHQRAGHYQEAERLYRQLVEEDIGLDLAHSQLASIYEAQQRWPDAVLERRYALNVNPDDPTMLYDLGLTLLDAGVPAEAEKELRRAIELNPREARSHYVLGIAYARRQQYAEAREEWERFLALAPRRYGEMIADAKARLARLP